VVLALLLVGQAPLARVAFSITAASAATLNLLRRSLPLATLSNREASRLDYIVLERFKPVASSLRELRVLIGGCRLIEVSRCILLRGVTKRFELDDALIARLLRMFSFGQA
jgi:hypothetical protein